MRAGLISGGACVLLITGCASNYALTAGTNSAKVRLTTSSDNPTTFLVRDTSNGSRVSDFHLASTGFQLRAMARELPLGIHGVSPQPPERTREREIAAGNRINIVIKTEGAYRVCTAGISFDVIPNTEYEIRHESTLAATECKAKVYYIRSQSPGIAAGSAVPMVPSQAAMFFTF